MSYHNSPLLAMPPLTSPPANGLHRHAESAETSGSSAHQQQHDGSSGSSSFLHQIPFQPTTVQHGPTPLTFGFGFGSSFGSQSTSAAGPSTAGVPWGQPPMSPSHRPQSSLRATPSGSGKRGEAKRRRGSSDEDSDDDMDGARERSGSPVSLQRVIASRQALPKRMRAGFGAVNLLSHDDGRASSPRSNVGSSESQTTSGGSSSPRAGTEKMDLGKILSTLDKPALLTLFSRLLTNSTDPSLREQIIAHIPSPSLESVESALDDIERSIRSACAHAGQMRAEFAWGRLRNPVHDFVTTVLGFLPFFVDDAKEGSVLAARQEAPHPSTTFSFLLALTMRTLRISSILAPMPTAMSASLFSPDSSHGKSFALNREVCPAVRRYQELMPADQLQSTNPNTIATQLIPSLLLHWSRLQEKLCKGVNEEGRMFGSEMMRGWILSLESVGILREGEEEHNMKPEARALRIALADVQAKLEQGVGWMIGLHTRNSSSNNNNSNSGQQAWRSTHTHHSGQAHRTGPSISSRTSTQMDEEEEI